MILKAKRERILRKFWKKLKMKMPEGPHHRITPRELTAILERSGFTLARHEKRLLFPAHIPFLSSLINRLGTLPLLRRLCLIEILEYRVAPGSSAPGAGTRGNGRSLSS